jgi:hypothetical protein
MTPTTIPAIPPPETPELCFVGGREGVTVADAAEVCLEVLLEDAVLDEILGVLVVDLVPEANEEVVKGVADADMMASPDDRVEAIVVTPRALYSFLTASSTVVLPPLGFANLPLQTLI